MKKLALIPCLLGVAFLAVGGLMVFAHSYPGARIIPSFGKVVSGPEEPQAEKQPEQVDNQTPLDKIGYLTILLSFGLLSTGLLINKKRN